jgi:hypothetical protein
MRKHRRHIKRYLPLILAGALLTGGIFLANPNGEAPLPKYLSTAAAIGSATFRQPPAPTRLVQAGPYGINVRSYFALDNLTISFKAGRLYVKNTDTLGFSNALLKKLVARDMELVVKVDGAQVLSLAKAYQEMPLDTDRFIIDHPRIRYPQDMRPPDRLMIEKSSKRVTIWHGTEKRVWDVERSGHGLFYEKK